MANTDDIDALLADIEIEGPQGAGIRNIETTPIMQVEEGESWEAYLANIHEYASKSNVDLASDPFRDLLTPEERREIVQRIEDDYKIKGTANCDELDYALAGICGVISGLVDSFFVGMPGASKLGDVADKVADKAVEKFAKFTYWCDKKMGGAPQGSVEDGNVASAIGYLERRFSVPYDARYAKDLVGAEGVVSFSTQDHHLKSIAHCPDPIGLFFSILDQFTGMTTVIGDGKIKRFRPAGKDDFRLQGTNLASKVAFGFINWLGHIMSDVAGSSGTRGHEGRRGAGVAAPFFEMFQLCNFGSFNVNGDKKTLAELTSSIYAHGYDARFAAAQAVPVALNEILIRLCWSVKRHYYHGLPWRDCVPTKVSDKPELRRMLLVGHGCLLLVDAADAAIRSWGNLMNFLLHINGVAWVRFAHLGFQELRALYKKDTLDVESMETDLKAEWEMLLRNSCGQDAN